LVDIVPMIIKKLSPWQIASAGAECVIVAFIVFHLSLPVPHIVKGAIVSMACALPVLLLLAPTEPKAIPVIVATQLGLGVLDGAALWLCTVKGWI
jgi:uncharacterized membrane protein YhfC